VTVSAPRRQARGEERREHILRAALAVIARGGTAAVTHRAVAAEAGVPLGSLTYYFASKQDLLREALRRFVAEEVERLERLSAQLIDEPRPPEDAVALVTEAIGKSDTETVAQFELYLEASRDPGLREAAEECLRAYVRVAGLALRATGGDEDLAPLFVALTDGLGVHRVAAPGAAADLGASLLSLFRAVAGARAQA
jgi:TetR/AcrR family transcriptional regulator, regulator of biofilm formation and stress response